jgi:hypothetical protein
MPFAHIAMAVEGCGWTHPDYFALMVANVVSWYLLMKLSVHDLSLDSESKQTILFLVGRQLGSILQWST